jgi:abequosyltransferase
MRLSLCIATFNRAAFLGETLDALVAQLTPDVEIVVVDGASPDDTPQVMSRYAREGAQVRYFRESENSGVDRDFDKAVERARGDHCWLMSDDDIALPGAIDAVLERLANGPDVVIANAEIYDRELASCLKPRQLAIESDRTYSPDQHEQLFADTGSYLSFIGGVIVRRAWWLARERAAYYGSLFIHVGVIFQAPAPARVDVIAQPLVRIRYGNAQWSARGLEIWLIEWPRLVGSFTRFAGASRSRVTPASPAASLKTLLWYRAIGALGTAQMETLRARAPRLHPLAGVAARLPRRPLNAALAAWCFMSGHADAAIKVYDLARAACGSATARWLATRSRFPGTGR